MFVHDKDPDIGFLTKIRSTLVRAINERELLPKGIIIILDNDLIRATGHTGKGLSVMMGLMIDWIAFELQEMIKNYKELLPNKSKRSDWPTIFWVESPAHKNFEDSGGREKFNKALNKIMESYSSMRILKIKKEWDAFDESFFHNRTYSSLGLEKYWKSIDLAFKHWETFIKPRANTFRSFSSKKQEKRENNRSDEGRKDRGDLHQDQQFRGRYRFQCRGGRGGFCNPQWKRNYYYEKHY